MLERVYAGMLLVILALIVVHAPLVIWLGTTVPAWAVELKAWKELIIVFAMGIAVVLVTKRQLWREFASDWLLRLMVAFTVLHVLHLALFWNGTNATLAGLAIDLRFVLYFGLVYILCRLNPAYQKPIVWAFAIGALVVGIFSILQVTVLPKDVLSRIGYGKDTIEPFLMVDKNPDYIRINSTLRGPNPLGLYAGIVLSLALAGLLLARRKVVRYKYLVSGAVIGAVVGLYASYSRSAIVASVLALVIIIGVIYSKRASAKIWALVVATIVAVALAGFGLRNSDFVANVILHDDPTTGAVITSNDAHVSSLQNGLKRFTSQPLGNGIGSSGSASLFSDKPQIIENQYLLVAHETGWLGLGLFVALFGLVLQRLWQQRTNWLALGLFASGVGIALAGFLLPVWADDTVAIIWWGLAGCILGVGYGKKHAR